MQNFEEELWFDIKQAKSSYLPKHIKIKEKNGCIAKTKRQVAATDAKRRRDYKAGAALRNAQRTLRRVIPRLDALKKHLNWNLQRHFLLYFEAFDNLSLKSNLFVILRFPHPSPPLMF